jgi:hypothetical protein
LLILIDPILVMPLILVMAVIAHRRQKPIERTDSAGDVTYMLHAQPEDAHIVEDIDNALEYVGLKRLNSSQSSVTPEYHIVVISDFGYPPKIE